MDFRHRQNCALERLREAHAEAAIIVSQANVRYLSGFVGEGLLLLGEQVVLVTDGRFENEAGAAVVDERVVRSGSHWASLTELITQDGPARIGFEAEHTTVARAQELREKLAGCELVPLKELVEPLRAVKSADEIEVIRRAARVTDEALERFLDSGPPRIQEKLAALEIVRLMLEQGADEAAFDVIVACGEGAAEPHHQPTDSLVDGPAPLKIDLGARVDGYCADLTRTVYIGGAPCDKFRQVYAAVYEAQQRAIEAVREGVSAREVDAVARECLEQAGLGEHFSHGLGHGVGLQVHERPSLSPHSEDVLVEGHVVTIEPGVYIRGWGGVRIEDLVLVTANGAEVLTSARKIDPAEW